MATLTKPTLKIAQSTTLGAFDATVAWTVIWDAFDCASGQPYEAYVRVYGDDTNVPGDTQSPDDFIDSTTFTIVPPATPGTQNKATVLTAISYPFMNEDETAGEPNPDEIRAYVRFTPQPPKIAWSPESDIVKLNLT